MRGSLRIGTLAGIGIYLHWSFFLLAVMVAWLVYQPIIADMGWTNHALQVGLRPFAFGLLFVLSIFGCVVLHELGHALAARKYGIPTRDITLYPIGGVARLERIPERPMQELVVALAGPAVNLVIAAALYIALRVSGFPQEIPMHAGLPVPRSPGEFLAVLMAANVFLLVFNLIPAFPMDGGRVLRAVLAFRLSFPTATRVAAMVGQVLAGIFVVLGLMGGNIFLALIGFFVFFGAQAEAQMAEFRGGLSGVPVRDAMITDFVSLSPDDTLERASDLLLSGSQQDFPVFAPGSGGFYGVLQRADLIKAIKSHGLSGRVGDVARRDCPAVSEFDMLYRVFQIMQTSQCPVVPVLRGGQLVGLVTTENVGELLMIRSALKQVPERTARRVVPATGH